MQAQQTTQTTASHWLIRVGGSDYGPYSLDQIRSFVTEGRVKSSSLVRREHAEDWTAAAQDAELAALFPVQRPPHAHSFGRPTQEHHETQDAPANFVIVCELTSGSAAKVGAAISKLGPSYELAKTVWVVNTANSAAGVRNAVAPHLAANDRLFIVDAARGKSAWQNLGPEADAKLRSVWRKQGA